MNTKEISETPSLPTTPIPEQVTFRPESLFLPQRTRRPNENLARVTSRLSHPLRPLFPLPGDQPAHPQFPSILLQYYLLTEEQLDSIAVYYHQSHRPDSPAGIWEHGYPECMNWDRAFLVHIGETKGPAERIAVKRRKVGKFIGLRGMETPVREVFEKEQWLRKRRDLLLKQDDVAFWGRFRR